MTDQPATEQPALPRRFKFYRVLKIMVDGVFQPADCMLDVIIVGSYDEKRAVLETRRGDTGLYLHLDPMPHEDSEVIGQGIFLTKDHPTLTSVEALELPPEFRKPAKSSLLSGSNITS